MTNADEIEKLSAFSYLFVPLLVLGMKGGERKKNKEQIIDVITVESLYFVTVTQQYKKSKGLVEQTENI